MSGLCGWSGWSSDSTIKVIGGMSDALTRFDNSSADAVSGNRAAVAAAGLHGTAYVYRDADGWLAICGHPRWVDSGAEVHGTAAVAAQFFAAYRQRGSAALASLKGDFALALVQEGNGEVLLAVDRMGVRPLAYKQAGEALIFGSTAAALTTHPLGSLTLDNQGIYNYVYFHMVPGPATVYHELVQLEPGHFLHFKNGRITQQPYWEMRFEENGRGGVGHYKADFYRSLRGAVKRCAGEGAAGAFLSGGTDSSTVCGMLGELGNTPARAYSIGFDAPGYDEMEYAQIAARHFALSHHAYYVTPDDVVDAIPKVAAIYDQPFGNASAVPTYFCARLAKSDGVACLLGGDGGDELFGGNARYAKQRLLSIYSDLPAWLRKGLVEPAVRAVPGGRRIPPVRKLASYIEQASVPMPARYESYNLLERLGRANVFTDDFLNSIDPIQPSQLMAENYRNAHAATLINRMLAIDFKFTLADNDLPKVTRMCELAGVDVTFPMLDDDVVEFSAALPPRLKLKGNKLRYFFKEALRDFLPPEILSKRKHGFGLPFGLWLQTHKPLQDLAKDSLGSLKSRSIVRPEFIDELTGTHLSQHAAYYGTMVWVLMMLEMWFQQQPARVR